MPATMSNGLSGLDIVPLGLLADGRSGPRASGTRRRSQDWPAAQSRGVMCCSSAYLAEEASISGRSRARSDLIQSRIRLQSKWRHRDDVTDDHLVVREDHPVDDQPQDLLPDRERRIDERVANAGAERLEPLQQPDLPLPLRGVAADLVEPLPQMPAMVLDLPPTLLQLLQLDRAGLI